MSIKDPQNLGDIVGGIGDQLGKGVNQIKEGAEKYVPGLKAIDTKIGQVVSGAKDEAGPVADEVSKFTKGLDPTKALKDFDPSNGTASIGENVAQNTGLGDSPSYANIQRPSTPSQATQAAQDKVQKDLDTPI